MNIVVVLAIYFTLVGLISMIAGYRPQLLPVLLWRLLRECWLPWIVNRAVIRPLNRFIHLTNRLRGFHS